MGEADCVVTELNFTLAIEIEIMFSISSACFVSELRFLDSNLQI